MDASQVRVFMGVIVVSAAVTAFALLGASIMHMTLSCVPPWAPMEIVRSMAYWGTLAGGFAIACVIVLCIFWRLQHTFVHALWTRRVLGTGIVLAFVAGAISVLFNQPLVHHVCT